MVPVLSSIRGFTLVELILTMAIISIAALAITSALGFALGHQADGISRIKSMALADSYLEQILATRFDENTPLGGVPSCTPASCSASDAFDDGESRAQYDDVDDFDGLDESPPRDAQGVVLSALSGYRVQVSVAYATPAMVTDFGLSSSFDAKVVTVSVTAPGQSTLHTRAIKGNF